MPETVMSYEYVVSIPANRRAAFREMVRMMGGRLSRARKVEDPAPNETTVSAMREAESGAELEAFDLKAFHEMVVAL